MKTKAFLLKFLPTTIWWFICLLWVIITTISQAHPFALLCGPVVILIAMLVSLSINDIVSGKIGTLFNSRQHMIKTLAALFAPIALWGGILILTNYNYGVMVIGPLVIFCAIVATLLIHARN